MYDVITVGSATVDVFVYTEKSDLITIRNQGSQEEFIAYPSGTKLLIKTLKFNTGGGGTNTAVALSRMGLKVGYVGAIGKDENGQIIRTQLQKEKISFLGSMVKEQTDYSVILNSLAHDRTILNYKGASAQLRFEDIDQKKLKQTKWIYCSSLVDAAYRTLEKISAFAVKNNINLAFNPSSYLAERGADYLKVMLRNSNVLIMNKEEAQDITQETEINGMLRGIKSFGCEHAIITDGKRGVYAVCGNERYDVLPHKVKVVESTGAGDSFASTFVGALAMGKDPQTALRLGIANAESVIRNSGAKSGLMSRKKLQSYVKNHPYKIIKKRFE